MSLTGLLDVLLDDPALAGARDLAVAGGSGVLDLSAPGGAWPAVTAALATRRPGGAGRPLLVVTATTREAEDLAEALRCFLPADEVVDFPSWETLPHERLSPRSDTVGRRLAVLRRLAHPDAEDVTVGPVQVVVAPVRAVLQPLVKGLGDLEPVRLQAGDEAELDDVARRLAGAAYTRTDLVERRGEFALRGGILDVFPPTEEHPLRVEFWGDTVEEIRYFAVADQRSLEIAPHGLWAPPCRELLLDDAVRERARALAPQLPGVGDLLEKVAEGIAVEGMESLTPALVDGMELLLDVLPDGAHVLLTDPERVRARAHDLVATSEEFLQASWANAAVGGVTPVDLEGVLGSASFRTLADVREHALETGRPWWSVGPFAVDVETTDVGEGAEASRPLDAHEVEPYRGDTARALEDLASWTSSGWRVVVVTEGHGLAQRVVEVLGERDVAARLVETLDDAPEPGVVHVATGRVARGFVAPGLRLALLSESDLTGTSGASTTKDMRRMPSRRRNVVDPLQLRPGDHVVHEQHGVGRFVEMVQRTVGAPPASTSSSSTPRASVGSRPTGCSCRATPSTR